MQRFEISHFKWINNGYEPKTTAFLSKTKDGFSVSFECLEKNPKAEVTAFNGDVYTDSCVEFFAMFSPDTDNRYLNFEINSIGTLHLATGKDRFERVKINPDEFSAFNIKTEITDAKWTAAYFIPFEFLKKYVDGFNSHKCSLILANFYKCGDKTDYPHFAMWNEVGSDKPDFHRPEFFKKIVF